MKAYTKLERNKKVKKWFVGYNLAIEYVLFFLLCATFLQINRVKSSKYGLLSTTAQYVIQAVS